MIDIKENLFTQYTDKETFDRIKEFSTMPEMWESVTREFALNVAIEDNGSKYTYSQLDEDMAAFRGVLKSNGIKKGDKVGVIIPSSYDFAVATLAITTYGAVAVLLPVQLDEKTVYGCSMKFGMSGIVYSNATEGKLVVAKNFGVKTINSSEKAEKIKMTKVDGKDGCVIMFTGGTTGKSKGALLSHKAVMTGVRNGCFGIKDVFNQRYFLILPLTHVFGFIRNFLTALMTGSEVYICRDLKNMFKEMAVFSPSILILVPALAEMALNLTKQIGVKILGRNLKTIIAGASHVPAHLIKEYKALGVTMLPGYGLTESANLVSGNPESERKPDSVGLPYPGQQFKLVDGELWIKGDNMMDCYVGDDEENQNAFEDGWFKTGDLVRIDDEGFMYIIGRIKEVIVLDSGKKVSPAEIEAKFCTPDYIADAMVYEDFTESGSQYLTLEVVPRVGFSVSHDQMKEELENINSSLPSYQRVNKIIIRDRDFDRTPAMKKIRIKKQR